MRARPALVLASPRVETADAASSEAAKRALDLAGAVFGLIVLALPMLFLALAIRLESPGPALFRQVRTGRGGLPFVILKFRTMRCEGGDLNAIAGGMSVTRLGAVLRPRGLDELPQFFNVLAGQMSLVGPRPHAVAEDDQLARLLPNYAARRRVRPGLSGWAQVEGWRGPAQGAEDMRERLHHDLWYIDHRSLGLDLLIIIRSLALVAGGGTRG